MVEVVEEAEGAEEATGIKEAAVAVDKDIEMLTPQVEVVEAVSIGVLFLSHTDLVVLIKGVWEAVEVVRTMEMVVEVEVAEAAAELSEVEVVRTMEMVVEVEVAEAAELSEVEVTSPLRNFSAEPDHAVQQLENTLIKAQSAELMQNTEKSTAASARTLFGEHLPARPAFGSQGRPIVVWANYFDVTVAPLTLYRYNLKVAKVVTEEDKKKGLKQSEVRGRKLQLVIAELLKLITGRANESDKNLIISEFKSQIVTSKKLDLAVNPVNVVLSEEAFEDDAPAREEQFAVRLTEPVCVNLSAFMDHVTSMKVPKDDAVFPRHPDVVDALNMMLGFGPRSNIDGISSARLATGRILLNTQVTHGVFNLAGQATEVFNRLGLRLSELRQNPTAAPHMNTTKAISKCFSKIRASVTFMTPSGRQVKRVRAIAGLVFASEMKRKPSSRGPNADRFTSGQELCGPQDVEFWNADEKRYVTVKDHFQTKYGLVLGNYPLLNFGHGDKSSYFPAEVVEIQQGQQAKLKLTAKETTAMLDFACRTPESNARALVETSRENLSHDSPLLKQLGVGVSKQLLAVNARIISEPKLRYRGADKPPPLAIIRNGKWNMSGGTQVVKSGEKMQRWAYVDILHRRGAPSIEQWKMKELIKNWQAMGMDINPESTVHEALDLASAPNTLDVVFKDYQSKGVQLIIILLPQKDPGTLYRQIKTLGDCKYGIHTSCVVRSQVEGRGGKPPQPGTLTNIGLKVNLKFGGVNQKLDQQLKILQGGNTMFVGYDVTHPTNMDPPKNGNGPPSLVGMVSSIDSELGQWPSVTWEQNSKQEILGPVLERHISSRIDLWQKKNGTTPLENIVIYRDGVSESQFSAVLTDELPLIRKACEKKCPSNPPKLTIVVSVKRHQTRFYPADGKSMSVTGNVPHGTVVDRGVTQARYWDFFLTAHHALKGTARPAHYTVLLDEIFRPEYGLEAANELEKVTHELCYLFGRATMAVSICPPAYYADIVCERARAHRPEYAGADDASEKSGPSSHGPAQSREVHPNLRDSMFYI
ncbi:Stem cell self-renewal protein Piwi [Cordyceps javanica]|uniref:Stem cell self-renewal protein Piwi n=1 Tax=Cordyceps javanica TaxID=43265 RepID=A0A545W3T4_9HYPO|nr:Stem cell self-renewal protein Piwi [Cordyceps javanica]TQW08657.1 Stem cell self-renewal protein Piwi [Cordyceps javanica]